MLNRFFTAGYAIVFGVLCLAVLIGYGVLRYPAVLGEGGAFGVVFPLALLAAYALAGWRIGRTTHEDTRTALRQGVGVGALLAAVMAVHLTVETFVTLPPSWNAAGSLGLFPILFLGFGCAGFRGATRTQRWRLGVLASVWSAMLCIVPLCIYGFFLNYLFMPHMTLLLRNSPEFLRSGMHDLTAFTVANSLESCGSHMVIAPFLAVLFGSIGGAAGKGLALRGAKSAASERSGKGLQRTNHAEFCA